VFEHVTLRVADLGASRAFYDAALGVLGYREPRDLRIVESQAPTRHLHVGLAA
jgi:catechol 2,3-dioxygenase-like lactoylglutathione lyase family enzyme